ncbi:hypothetical protein DBR43_27420 [Pedobacter sp. KBW06]|nr:hypothetical protein DBR43_27420 [Pedobacter sp. KBW06]
MIRSGIKATNRIGLALRKINVKVANTPNIANAIKQAFIVDFLLTNSFKLNSDSFFIMRFISIKVNVKISFKATQ